jgi:hypothetical protein
MLCVSQDRGIADLVLKTGMESNRLRYYTSALVKLGLLKIAGNRRPEARASRLYRAAAPAFIVPHKVSAQPLSLAAARHLQEQLQAARSASDEGILYYADLEGRPQMQRLLASKRLDAAVEIWRVCSLSRRDAQRLSSEIADLLKKYDKPTGLQWLVHFAFCPKKPESATHKDDRTLDGM